MTTRQALLLDGRRREHSRTLAVAHDALRDGLSSAGWAVDDWALRGDDVSFCTGCFGCWVKTPGVCVGRGAARSVAERVIASGLVVLLTPVTFGGYSAEMKKALDHVIPVLLPFFRKVDGDTRHTMRYDSYPDLLAVGAMDSGRAVAEGEAETFRHLVARNALNLAPPTWDAGTLPAEANESEVRHSVTRLLAQVNVGGARVSDIEATEGPASSDGLIFEHGGGGIVAGGQDAPRSAVHLIGSPKPGSSTSSSLGEHLLGLLAERGLDTETVSLSKALRSPHATDALCASVDAADLVVLSFPLYVDSLPGVVTRALEIIAGHRTRVAADGATTAGSSGAEVPAFMAICQSGFPEQSQNAVALRICRHFAQAAGFEWAGGLPMGGGAMLGGRRLAELGGRVRHQARALELAAAALCDGREVPAEAVSALGKLPVPALVYRAGGNAGWRKQAKEAGVLSQLAARPFVGPSEEASAVSG